MNPDHLGEDRPLSAERVGVVMADAAYEQVKAAALDLAGWVQQFRRECEVPDGARDLMLRASIRQSMYDAADLLVDDFGRSGGFDV